MVPVHSVSVRRGILFVALAATAWGTGGAAAALLYRHSGLGPVAVSFWRFLIGVWMLAGVRLLRSARRRSTTASFVATALAQPRQVLTSGLGLAVSQTMYFAAVRQSGLAVATVVAIGAAPVLIALGARVILEERIGVLGGAGVATGVLGLVLLVSGVGNTSGSDPALGVGYAVLSAVGYAGVTLLSRAEGRKGDGSSVDSALAGFAVGALCLLPPALLEGALPGNGSAATLLLLIYLGAVPTALAYLFFFAGLTSIRAATASIVALIEPLIAAVIGLVVLGEHMDPAMLLGAVVLLGSVFAIAVNESGSTTEMAGTA